ncbi:cell division protein FtsZ, partial [Wolbachia pipientis]|uniref:cell division protein FtsZ n=1 Tax=Wolbachia pipientis TaxID=955 RepID=UPI0011D0F967
AELGLEELQKHVDTLIVIPNQNLFRIADENTTFSEAFQLADNVLHIGIRGVTDLMVMPGLINLDFADIETVMSEMGKAMIGTGEAEGEDRAINAAEAAISNPLLDNVSMKGARGILINITGGLDMTLFEVDSAANRVREEVDENANIIFGATFDEEMEGRIRVSVLATGIDSDVDYVDTDTGQSKGDKEKFKWSYSQTEQKEKQGTTQKNVEQAEKMKWNGNVYDIPAYLRRKKR